ncbi:MAG: T9SS type A sorting domain-containing protein [Flavobacteriales bacterium]|nr:T9SS type A sorting domain-containing protein [Flavobacteriales bacterium]
MTPRYTLIAILGSMATLVAAQVAPDTDWQRSYGGSGNEGAVAVRETTDGGFVFGGHTDSNDGDVSGNHGGLDAWVGSTDAGGALLWKRAIGGTGDDEVRDSQRCADGGSIHVGYTFSDDGDISGNHGSADVFVIRLDSLGNVLWARPYGGTGFDEGRSVVATADGGFVVAGFTTSDDGDVSGLQGGIDYWLFKLDDAGTLLWQRTLGGTGSEFARAVQPAGNDGFIVAGYSDSNDGDVTGNHGNNDMWVVRVDANGAPLWQTSLGGTVGDGANALATTADGGFIVAGSAYSDNGDVVGNHGTGDAWVVKLDSLGGQIWQISLGGTNTEEALSAVESVDGGILLACTTGSNDGDVTGFQGVNDYWLVKLDSDGGLLWQKSYGGTNTEQANCLEETADGGIILAGASNSVDGDLTSNAGLIDVWLVRLKGLSTGTTDAMEARLAVSPNPSNGVVTISGMNSPGTLLVTDALGRIVHSERVTVPNHRMDLEAFSTGVYQLTLRTAEGIASQRLVLQH